MSEFAHLGVLFVVVHLVLWRLSWIEGSVGMRGTKRTEKDQPLKKRRALLGWAGSWSSRGRKPSKPESSKTPRSGTRRLGKPDGRSDTALSLVSNKASEMKTRAKRVSIWQGWQWGLSGCACDTWREHPSGYSDLGRPSHIRSSFERGYAIETQRGRTRLSGKRAQIFQRREGAEREGRTSKLTTTPILDHHPMLHESRARTDINCSPSRLPEGAGGEGTRKRGTDFPTVVPTSTKSRFC